MVTTHPGRGVQSPPPPQATGVEYQGGGWGSNEAGGDGALRAAAYMNNGMAGTMGLPVSMSNTGGSTTTTTTSSSSSRGGGGGTPPGSTGMAQPMAQVQPQSIGVMYPSRSSSTGGTRLTTAGPSQTVGGGNYHHHRSGGSSPVEQGGNSYVSYVTQAPMSAIFYQTSPMPLQMAGHMHAVNALAPSLPVQSMASLMHEAQPSIPATFYPSGKRAAYGMPHEILGLEGDMGAGAMMMINGGRPNGTASGQERRSFYACPRCDKQFTLKGNLKRHQLTHQNHKPYICEICRKGFSRKADLEIHNRVHTGEKPYDCMEPGCGKKFARISDLRSHERTHSGVKAFKCTFRGCERTFARRYDMKKHVKVHNKDTEGRILEHGIHLGYAAPPPPPPETYHPEDGNGLSPHYGDNQLAGQYGGSMGSAAMARWAQDYIGGATGLELQLQSGREDEEAVMAMQQQQQAMATNDATAAAYYQQAQSQVHHHQQHEQQQRAAMGVDGVTTSTESVKTDGRGYIYVYHNDHVDMVSPGRALECKDYPNTRVDESAQQHYPILTDVEIRQANEACSGNHGTDTCPCVRIHHGDHVDCVVDLRLKHRRPDGQLEDHGQIRIIKNEEDNFIQAISSFSTASSPTNGHAHQQVTTGHSTNSAKL